MRSAHDETLHLRLPAALRQDLDGTAQASGARLSVIARTALSVGLASLRASISPDDNDTPPPAAPSALSALAA